LNTVQTPVLWCDFDNGQGLTDERFAALGKARALSASAPVFYVSMDQPWLDMSMTRQTVDLIEYLRVSGTGLLVIDNLGVTTGGADEITAEMAGVMSNLRLVAERVPCAVLLIHHQRKDNGSKRSRKGDALRGHSSIEAALDLALLIQRDGDNLTLTATKTRRATMPALAAMFTYTQTPDRELETARFVSIPVQIVTIEQQIEDAVLDLLRQSGQLNQTAILQRLRVIGKWPKNRVLGTLTRLVGSGMLHTTNGARGALLYSI
jgi:hypothetical protein